MDTIQIRSEQGLLEGEKKGEIMVFRGIPYAEAPIGENRFRAPSHKKPWSGVRQAISFAPGCPGRKKDENSFYVKEFHGTEQYPDAGVNEDCLYLNIWAPTEPGNYPVAVYLHGGSFERGSGAEIAFDGEKFAANGVILVTVNYRTGVFGFFADEALRRESPHRITGNYGILDQIAALQWVWRNIHFFGGNADHITLFGQSAGAISTQALVSSPLTEGLIHSAIMQSGGGLDNGVEAISMEQALETGRQIKEHLGVTTIEEMRRLPAEKLVDVLDELPRKDMELKFGPALDNYILKESFGDALRNGHVLDIPYMIGVTANDISVGKDMDVRDSIIFKGCVNFCECRLKTSDKPVYLYNFARRLPGDEAGAFHSAELWYVFGTLNRSWRPMERRDYSISYKMIENWTSFIKNDDPGKDWRSYDEEDQFVRQFM